MNEFLFSNKNIIDTTQNLIIETLIILKRKIVKKCESETECGRGKEGEIERQREVEWVFERELEQIYS